MSSKIVKTDTVKNYAEMYSSENEMLSAKSLSTLLLPFYKKNMHILDLCCGQGHYLASLQRRIDSDISYVGVDISEKACATGKEHFQSEHFVCASAYALPFANNTFDICFLTNCFSVFNMPALEIITEMSRITSSLVILRTEVGISNYQVKIFYDDLPLNSQEYTSFMQNSAHFSQRNIYSAHTLHRMAALAAPAWNTYIISDPYIEGIPPSKIAGATKVVNGMQIAGSLILNWHYLILSKKQLSQLFLDSLFS